MLRRTLVLIPLAAVLAVGVAAPSGAQSAPLRTASNRTVICSPQGLVSSGTFPTLASAHPVVVQTGMRPMQGPGLPVSLLTTASSSTGYHFRAFDQNGASVAALPSANNCYYFSYHASIPFTDSAHAAGTASVTTDASGVATVRFAGGLGATPVSVVVTGSSPTVGAGLPLNIVSGSYSPTGFVLRALDQAGAPIASRTIRVHYWATTQTATPNTRAAIASVTPDQRGFAFISWPLFAKGLPPVSVILTGVGPTGGPNMPVNLLADAAFAGGGGVRIRVLNQHGQPISSSVRIAFYATKAPTSPL
jgi:hypothetical protein